MSERLTGESAEDSHETHPQTHPDGTTNDSQHLRAAPEAQGESGESVCNATQARARAHAHTRASDNAKETHQTHHTHPQQGPVRTMKVGQRITVYGDVEIVAIEGRRVQVRVHRASSPPPGPVMFPVRE